MFAMLMEKITEPFLNFGIVLTFHTTDNIIASYKLEIYVLKLVVRNPASTYKIISFALNILDFRQVTASTEHQSKLYDDVCEYIMTHSSFIVSNKFQVLSNI